MNRNKLETYARQARRDFIAAVTDRAAFYGLTAQSIEPVVAQGDVTLIGGRAFPRNVAESYKRLEDRIRREGFQQVMEAMAYTWFNRFAAIRYMELHGYLDHGYRVLSHPEDKDVPEIVEHAEHVELPGLKTETIIDLKLDGTKEAELYRLLLIAQCNALHDALPFLFERIDDETELLIPDNLLHSNSLIRTLVSEIDAEDWQEVEIIGWLYQFYISERKYQVIGKVVKSEDIPAATQLFTPNWIVKYLVQNSLGAQWLETNPDVSLREKMKYYIEPTEQTPEVQAQLKAITPDSLNPEELTLLDPACGSGHILVEAYELLKEIYLECGYRVRDIPTLILQKNLFGLEIDDRAAQLAAFALMMKARADDRRIFGKEVQPQVLSFQESKGLNAKQLTYAINAPVVLSKQPDSDELEFMEDVNTPLFAKKNLAVKGEIEEGDIETLVELFVEAKTFGSLITIPDELTGKLPMIFQRVEDILGHGDLEGQAGARGIEPLVQQAGMLTAQYDAVVANPPYMGRKGMNPRVKKFVKDQFPDTKSDLFACFIERGYTLAKDAGHNAMVTMQSWMFLSSFEKMRERILREKTIVTMAHMANGVMGIAFGTAATVLRNFPVAGYVADYSHTSVEDLSDQRVPFEFPVRNNRLKRVAQDELKKIPGSPVAYWVSARIRAVFEEGTLLGKLVDAKVGLQTGDNDRFLRFWPEVDQERYGYGFASRVDAAESGRKWFPYNKGGEFRRWYGNQDYLVNWENDGRAIRAFGTENGGRARSVLRNTEFYFLPSVTWSFVSSSYFGVRYSEAGKVFDVGGSSAFPPERDYLWITGFLCSKQVFEFMKVMNPTLNFQVGNVAALPVIEQSVQGRQSEIENVVSALIGSARTDWNAYERSWNFQSPPILTAFPDTTPTLESSYDAWTTHNRDTIAKMKRLEEENNRLFIDAYGLAAELTPDVPIEEITLTVNPAYRYGGELTEEELWARFRQDTMKELVSYAIGCMMGRYSLDAPGLIYAHSFNADFNPSRYTTFPADLDGIVPLTDSEWFDDDACHRLIKFIAVAWDKAYLEDNLSFLADNLSPRNNESSRETLRRYLCDGFFKDHLQTYKKRPIYWLFSSGTQKAFQCLVYLHRYNEGTLARMRTEYVIPLQGMIASRVRKLEGDIGATASTSHRKRQEKERASLVKQQSELREFDEKLRHYADQRIRLDLDDGVKINYGKFGDLLAEVRAVTGTEAD